MTGKRYFIRTTVLSDGKAVGYRSFDVIDRQTGKAVYSSIFQGRALATRNRMNIGEASIAGGFNKRTK